MPFLGYTEDGAVLHITRGDGTSLIVSDRASIPGGVISAAVAGDDALYYIPKATPASLHRLALASGKDEAVQDLVRPYKKLFFHRNKVFCIPANDSGVAVYDPLCNVVEILPIPFHIKYAEAADHGFVFRTVCNRTFGYDLNSGLVDVKDGSRITAFLGHFKRYAVVRLLDGSEERVVGVTETGDTVPLTTPLPRVPFAECDDAVLHVEGTEVVSAKGERAALPSAAMTLTSSPPSDEEVSCSICLCEFDGEDGVTLDCGHLFHKECIEQWVSTWMDFAAKGEHIIFTHAVCASGCKYLIRHPLIPQSKRIGELHHEVTAKKAAQLAHFEATKTDEDLLYYICGKCGGAFFGGERVCSRMQGREPSSSPPDLICDDCLAATHARGEAFVPVFKCRYCCNPATHRSFGTRYMCDACNARWDTTEPPPLPCRGSDHCPFDGEHGESAGGYVGCLLCSRSGCDIDHVFDRVVPPPPSDSSKSTT